MRENETNQDPKQKEYKQKVKEKITYFQNLLKEYGEKDMLKKYTIRDKKTIWNDKDEILDNMTDRYGDGIQIFIMENKNIYPVQSSNFVKDFRITS